MTKGLQMAIVKDVIRVRYNATDKGIWLFLLHPFKNNN